ncbi:hypothetical protein P3T76_004365 [Phytophthora citrophthora]|uniref:Uncharacterized protein n=1 Tax=Phytophthora citrophthora TaxID=4793 RepID=A0AAD9LP13_9STRA|nr:hypothetical protein P3T76_004365 [Phytophthora citrophthora]
MSMPLVIWLYVQWMLETHGWKMLGAALLFYVGRQRYREFSARRHHQRTLADANGKSPFFHVTLGPNLGPAQTIVISTTTRALVLG